VNADPQELLQQALDIVAADLGRIKADVDTKQRMLGVEEAQTVTGYIRVLVAASRQQMDPEDNDLEKLMEKAAQIPEVADYFSKLNGTVKGRKGKKAA
jgi:hypothetical protein